MERPDESGRLAALRNPSTQQHAFRALVHEYQRPLYQLIRQMVVDHDDADDVLQNTFVKVFQNIHNFKGDSRLYSWVYRIAVNESLTFLQQKKRRFSADPNDSIAFMSQRLQADVHFDGEAGLLRLQAAVYSLPEKQQLVFRMKYFEAMTYESMSEILETSVGALKASYHHAVKKIETLLQDD